MKLNRNQWIKLALVAALIIIVASIAIPKINEARTRARVKRVIEDQRSIISGDTYPDTYHDARDWASEHPAVTPVATGR